MISSTVAQRERIVSGVREPMRNTCPNMETTEEHQVSRKEKRLLKVWNQEVDPIVFRYNRPPPPTTGNGVSKFKGHPNSQTTVDRMKRVISSYRWFGRAIEPVSMQLYVQPNPSDTESIIGPLPVLDRLGQYLDNNEAILLIKFVTVDFSLTGKVNSLMDEVMSQMSSQRISDAHSI